MHNHSYENVFHQVNEISFSYEWTDTKTRFEKETEKSLKVIRKINNLLMIPFFEKLGLHSRYIMELV